MFKPFYLYIGTRYTNLKRRDHFITFISLVSMIGIALGIIVLITVLSVMNGFSKEIRERILSVTPQLIVNGWNNHPIDDPESLSRLIAKEPLVESQGPYIEGQGMVTRSGYVSGVLVKGIQPESIEAVFPLESALKEGSLKNLQPGKFGAIIGERLANSLDVKVGDKITLVIPEVSVTLAGATPRLKQLEVVGLFEVGYIYDAGLVFVHLDDAKRLYKIRDGGITGIQVKLKDPFKSPELVHDLKQKTEGRFLITDWTELNATYFSAVRMEKRMMFLTLMMILAIAAFNLISTLVMVVTDKRSDIAILRTLGASRQKIMAIFVCQGAIIGVVGTIIGVVLGVILALNVESIVKCIEQMFGVHFLSKEVYFISDLPSQLQLQDVLWVAGSSLLLSLLATIVPAYRAANVQPAEGLRHEH